MVMHVNNNNNTILWSPNLKYFTNSNHNKLVYLDYMLISVTCFKNDDTPSFSLASRSLENLVSYSITCSPVLKSWLKYPLSWSMAINWNNYQGNYVQSQLVEWKETIVHLKKWRDENVLIPFLIIFLLL